MYAVILTGGKQYKVASGDVINVEKIDVPNGSKIELDTIMIVDGDNVDMSGKKVNAHVIDTFKGKKIVVFKYKAKKNVRKKQGHRQQYTKIKIELA